MASAEGTSGAEATSGAKTTGNPRGRPRLLTADGRALSDIAREHTEAAITALADVMRGSGSDAARVSAANALLDRGWGKPRQEMEIDLNISGDLAELIAVRRKRVVEERGDG